MKLTWVTPFISWRTHTAYIHAQRTIQRTVNYGVVIVSRNLERTNENDGFKMTALETMNIGGINGHYYDSFC